FFEQESVLILLVIVPLFALFFVWRGWKRAAILRKIGDTDLVASLTAQISPFRRQLKHLLWLVGAGSLVLALARPVWGIEQEIIRTEGVQIVIAMDISRSMNAEDVSPSRIERARFDAQGIMDAVVGNDVGMVVFARQAFAYMPLTYDRGAMTIFLDGISTTMVRRQGTNIPAAIERGMGAFEPRSDAYKVLILMTDGESHEGDAIAAAELAAEQGIRIYTIGYGSQEGANIPIFNDAGDLIGYQTQGNVIVNTAQNVSLLQQVAELTGGFYIRGGIDLTPLYSDILALESGDIGEEVITRPIERFQVFVVIALAALSIGMLIPETKRDAD
ncbi:MAG: VWA domain-containing protein, partial [Chloroflexota bacterium]